MVSETQEKAHTGSGIDKPGLLSASANYTMTRSPRALNEGWQLIWVLVKKIQDVLLDLTPDCVCVCACTQGYV